MVRTKLRFAVIISSALGLAVACTKSSPNLTSPSGVRPGAPNVADDGSTLKVTAPTPVSPVNSQKIEGGNNEIALVVTNASATFDNPVALSYRFEVYNAAGSREYRSSVIAGGSAGTTSHLLAAALQGDERYTWRARAEFEGETGPWSNAASFIAPNTTGYIRGNELYDPLINGKTVGQVHGRVTFIPGVGVRLESVLSYISYVLPQTLLEGEFSVLVTDMSTESEGGKTKLFAMGEGFGDIVTNDRRMTVEKRSSGIIAWRFITHGDQIDTIGAERVDRHFRDEQHYFWKATWRSNRFNLLINEGGVNGRTIYNFGKPFEGRAYDPSPHVIYVGAPVGRSGPDGASVSPVTIRQVWVSGRPRPGFAN